MQPFYKRFSVITGFWPPADPLGRQRLRYPPPTGRAGGRIRYGLITRSEVLLELSQTESLLKDAETGQRGYLYTGEPKYLAPYNLALTAD